MLLHRILMLTGLAAVGEAFSRRNEAAGTCDVNVTDFIVHPGGGVSSYLTSRTGATGTPASGGSGLVGDQPVRCASVVGQNVPLSGSTITTLDGVTLRLNDRVLLWQQANMIENGIYTVSTLAGTNGAIASSFTRAPDAATGAQLAGYSTDVQGGSQQGVSFIVQGDPATLVLGSSAVLILPQGVTSSFAPLPATSTAPTVGNQQLAARADHQHAIPLMHNSRRVRASSAGTSFALTGGVATTMDGINLNVGDEVLLKDQVAGAGTIGAADNGVYRVVQIAGIGGAATTTFQRVADMNTVQSLCGGFVCVMAGNTEFWSQWFLQLDPFSLSAPVLGVTALTYTQFFGTRAANGGAICDEFQVAVTGAADVQVLTPAAYPFAYVLMDCWQTVTNIGAGGGTTTLRTAAGGLGTPMSSALSTNLAGVVRNAITTFPGRQVAGTPLFVRMTDTTAVLQFFFRLQRQ